VIHISISKFLGAPLCAFLELGQKYRKIADREMDRSDAFARLDWVTLSRPENDSMGIFTCGVSYAGNVRVSQAPTALAVGIMRDPASVGWLKVNI